MWHTFPIFGTTLLLAVMVVASYTFAVSLLAGANGKLKTLQSARYGAYGTVLLIGVSVMCLAYAFVSHDFRLRYVSHYSDRSMSTAYLLTALWGGQDGSLLWWLFLLSLYIGVCVWTLGKKHLELQPYVIATLMGVVLFFCVLMAFAANPFSTSVAGATADGEGLNPLLQNFYMIIHPPSLYVGFVGCSVPFAFGVAALVTGRLDTEWIQASRKFSLFALLFLAIGNTLGMLWAYEELGWGGYWAWDPVENAAFMPLLSMAAFVHSVMIQERRGMLKVWNVALICLTFFMTIFGTFLTRSGAIASVHSFAQSSIGEYFVWFLVFLAAFTFTLILYRWPELRDLPPTVQLRKAAVFTGWFTVISIGGAYVISSRLPVGGGDGGNVLTGALQSGSLVRVAVFSVLAGGAAYAAIELVFRRMTLGLKLASKRPQMESVWSREFTFLLNNWGLLGFMLFVLVATTFPMVSEALWKEKVTVGPPYYNAWVQPIALTIFFLMGAGTLFGWKKTSDEALKKNFMWPIGVTVGVAALQLTLGKRMGYPGIVWSEPIYGGALGKALQAFNAVTPVLGMSLVAFNVAVIVQEFVLLFRARARTGADKTPRILYWLGGVPGFFYTVLTLPPSGRRRYGGYLVHLGIALAFFGFTGKSWTVDQETTLSPGGKHQIDRLTIEYVGPRMEVDMNKRMIFADVRVTEGGKPRGTLSPAKFIYKKMPESPTTEVSMLHSVRDDLYLVVGQINPQTKVASLQIHLNPLVGWIWFGAILFIIGSFVCMWPELEPEESRVWQFARGAAGGVAAASLALVLAILPTPAYAQSQASQHSGSVQIDSAKEREIFGQLRCMCGTCPRELLSTCACSTADATRERLRLRLARGEEARKIIDDYVEEYGPGSLAIPPNQGALRAIYVLPLAAIVGGGLALAIVLKRWRKESKASSDEDKKKKDDDDDDDGSASAAKKDYDERIDAALRDMDG